MFLPETHLQASEEKYSRLFLYTIMFDAWHDVVRFQYSLISMSVHRVHNDNLERLEAFPMLLLLIMH